MKRSHGGEGVDGKCRNAKGYDLLHRHGYSAEFR